MSGITFNIEVDSMAYATRPSFVLFSCIGLQCVKFFTAMLIFLYRAQASLPGFEVLPLRQFGTWGPEINAKFDPQKDTYVMVTLMNAEFPLNFLFLSSSTIICFHVFFSVLKPDQSILWFGKIDVEDSLICFANYQFMTGEWR